MNRQLAEKIERLTRERHGTVTAVATRVEPDTPANLAKTEKQFLADVRKLASRHGWMTYHTHNSLKSEAGFPDLVMLRGRQMIVAELKVASNTVTPAQEEWMKAFVNADVPAFAWRPENWPEIERMLTASPTTEGSTQ